MRESILTLLFLSLFFACKTESQSLQKKEYPRIIGDISKDSLLDNPNFKVCDSLERGAQYYHKKKSFAYTGEKAAVLEVFANEFKPLGEEDQNGWIRIRFMVNCEGQTGRFRMIESNFDYEEFQFDKIITDQLMSITKSLDGWEILSHQNTGYDYYQYLIFKIEDGQLTEILP